MQKKNRKFGTILAVIALFIIGCSVTVHAEDPELSKAVFYVH